MNKVILIEDRTERMKKNLKEEKISLSGYAFLDIYGKKYVEKFRKKLNMNDLKQLDQYAVIMTHQSVWKENERKTMKDYCKEKNKSLVFFSGGNSKSYYKEKPTAVLTIDVNKFYSSNLKVFLDYIKDYDQIDLPRLQYGKKWKLDVLLKSRNDIAVYLQLNKSNKRINIHIVRNEIGLTPIFKKIQEEHDYDLEWFDNNVTENPTQKWNDIISEINHSIVEEMAKI